MPRPDLSQLITTLDALSETAKALADKLQGYEPDRDDGATGPALAEQMALVLSQVIDARRMWQQHARQRTLVALPLDVVAQTR